MPLIDQRCPSCGQEWAAETIESCDCGRGTTAVRMTADESIQFALEGDHERAFNRVGILRTLIAGGHSRDKIKHVSAKLAELIEYLGGEWCQTKNESVQLAGGEA